MNIKQFVDMGIINTDEAEKLNSMRSEINDLRDEIGNKMQNDHKEFVECCKSYVIEETERVNTLIQLLNSDEFKSMYEHLDFSTKVDLLLNKIFDDSFRVLHSKKRLEDISSSLIALISQYLYEQQLMNTDIEQNIGKKIWNEYNSYFSSVEFFNMLSRVDNKLENLK